MLKTKICPNCGKEFTPSNGSHIYCSRKCAFAKYHQVYKKVAAPRACAICGEMFDPQSKAQRTCGKDDCKLALYERNGHNSRCKFDRVDVKNLPKKKRGMSNVRWNNLSPAERWKRMSSEELSLECLKFDMDYGDSQSAYYNGTLPSDFGKR